MTVTATSSSSTAGSSRRNLRPQNATSRTRPTPVDLGQQQRRDQEAGEGEEQIDAEESPSQLAGVEEQHGDHRQAAQPVERGDVRTRADARTRGRLRRNRSRERHLRPLGDDQQRLTDAAVAR